MGSYVSRLVSYPQKTKNLKKTDQHTQWYELRVNPLLCLSTLHQTLCRLQVGKDVLSERCES